MAQTLNSGRVTKKERKKEFNRPLYQALDLYTRVGIMVDDKVMRPIGGLLANLMGGLGAERRVSDETPERDGSQRPPTALISFPCPFCKNKEYLGHDAIRRSICLL